MRRPVDLILPDTGPLITLAAADRLELLTSFGRPVMIPDVIREEATGKPGTPGCDRLIAWFGGTGHNQFKLINTPLIDAYRRLKNEPPRPDGTPAAHGMGEATLMWVVANVEQFHARDTMCLVLTEDGRAGDQMPDSVHVLSTRSWLVGLERLGVIESAKAVLDDVLAKGRTPSPYSRDQRGKDAHGNTSEWTKSVILPDTSPHRNAETQAADVSGNDDALGTRIHKILVTKDELSTAIDRWSDRTNSPRNEATNPISDLLVEAGDAVVFETHHSGGKVANPGETLYGIRAIIGLERGFGKTKYRSLIIDETRPSENKAEGIAVSLQKKIRTAANISAERVQTEPKSSAKIPKKGTGLAD